MHSSSSPFLSASPAPSTTQPAQPRITLSPRRGTPSDATDAVSPVPPLLLPQPAAAPSLSPSLHSPQPSSASSSPLPSPVPPLDISSAQSLAQSSAAAAPPPMLSRSLDAAPPPLHSPPAGTPNRAASSPAVSPRPSAAAVGRSPLASPRTDTDDDDWSQLPGSPASRHIGSRMLIHVDEKTRTSLISMHEDATKMIVRAYIADDNHLAGMGLNGTFKTIALGPDMSTDDMRQLLLEKITRGMKAEQKTTILSTCSHYHFDLKNKLTGVEERLESSSSPYHLFRQLPRHEDYYLVFQPPGVPIRAYLPDDPVLRQLGLNDTFKSLFISLSTTTVELEAMMVRKMVHGLNAQQIELLESHLRPFHMCVYTSSVSRPLGRYERPLTLLRNDPDSARFLFQPNAPALRRGAKSSATASIINAPVQQRRESVLSVLDDELHSDAAQPPVRPRPPFDLRIALPQSSSSAVAAASSSTSTAMPPPSETGLQHLLYESRRHNIEYADDIDDYIDDNDVVADDVDDVDNLDDVDSERRRFAGELKAQARRRRRRDNSAELLRHASVEKLADLHSPQTPPASPSSQRLWEIASAATPSSPSSHSTDSEFEYRLRPPGLPVGTSDEWIVVNVGGYRYETYRSTLSRFPDSVLHAYIKQDLLSGAGEYRIDRNGRVFEGILEYCRTGQIFCPPGISEEQLAAEFAFFRFPYKCYAMLHGRSFARQFREPEKWRNAATALFQSLGASMLSLIEKESLSGENYHIRVALLPVEELQQCEGKLGDIIRGPVRLAPHPSKGGGWCLVIEHARRYFVDQLRKCFEDLDFKTSLEAFRYCGCPPCTKHHLMTRYLIISWADRAKPRILQKCEKLLETLESGVSVWVLNQ